MSSTVVEPVTGLHIEFRAKCPYTSCCKRWSGPEGLKLRNSPNSKESPRASSPGDPTRTRSEKSQKSPKKIVLCSKALLWFSGPYMPSPGRLFSDSLGVSGVECPRTTGTGSEKQVNPPPSNHCIHGNNQWWKAISDHYIILM